MGYDLHEKVVLITGASSGIGRACAVAFHDAGSRVVAVARRAEKLADLEREIGDDRIASTPIDITDADARQAAIEFAYRRFGRIDVLINNAGWASFSTVRRMPADHLERMIALNLVAPIAMTQAVLEPMIERSSGQIVNISSVVGNQTIPRMTVYSATKAALSSFSTGLRMELHGSGVDVILVSPGSTATPFFETAGCVDVRAERVAHSQYTPQRVARAVVRSCRKRRAEVTLTLEGKAVTAIRRCSHRLADAIMYSYAKKGMPSH
ncbi:MAG: SDR family NAD(P)-dependent oxidoreductase [Phycisphaerae bacterium]